MQGATNVGALGMTGSAAAANRTAINITGTAATGVISNLALRTNNADRLTINNNGNVTIAAPSSGNALAVTGNTNITGNLTVSGTISGTMSVTPAGSTGQVQFNNAGALGANANFFWDNTNSRLGIGTATPSTRLEVSGATLLNGGSLNIATTAGETATLLRSDANSANFFIAGQAGAASQVLSFGPAYDWDRLSSITYTPGTTGAASGVLRLGQTNKNNALWTHGVTAFNTNGAERMRIDNAGNIGIGTASPQTRVQVSGSLTVMDGGEIYRHVYWNGTAWQYLNTAAPPFVIRTQSANVTNLAFGPGGTAGGTTAMTGNIYLDGSTGNVGIGATTPNSRLEVAGVVHAVDSGTTPDNGYNGIIRITRPTSANQYMNFTKAGTTVASLGYAPSSTTFGFGAGQATDASFSPSWLAMTNTGNVGIGTATPGAFRLNVNGDTNITGNLTVSGTITGSGGTAAGGSNTQVQFNNSGVLGGSANFTFTGGNLLDVNGTMQASTVRARTSTAGLVIASQSATAGAGSIYLNSPNGTSFEVAPAGATVTEWLRAWAGTGTGAALLDSPMGQGIDLRASAAGNGNLRIRTTGVTVQRTAGASAGADIVAGDGTQFLQLNSNSSAGSWNPMVQAGDTVLNYSKGAIDTGSLVIGPHSATNKGIRIDASGNVGIGTAAPSARLHTAGGRS